GRGDADATLASATITAVGFVVSTPRAQYSYSNAARTGKRAQCFGGAKNHAVIMPDADFDQVADAMVGAGFGSAGERCMAISVAVAVGEGAAEKLLENLRPTGKELKVGHSHDPQPDCGQLGSPESRTRVLDYIEQGEKDGADVLIDGRGVGAYTDQFGGQDISGGYFVGPTLLDNVTTDMSVYTDEIFGPVLTIVHAESFDDALRLPNENEYGNGVAIFTRDGDAAREFVSRVEVGMVGVNVPIPVPIAYHTFGGWKKSGFGDLNQHGPESIKFYSKVKTVTQRWPSAIKDGAEFVIPTMD